MDKRWHFSSLLTLLLQKVVLKLKNVFIWDHQNSGRLGSCPECPPHKSDPAEKSKENLHGKCYPVDAFDASVVAIVDITRFMHYKSTCFYEAKTK